MLTSVSNFYGVGTEVTNECFDGMVSWCDIRQYLKSRFSDSLGMMSPNSPRVTAGSRRVVVIIV